MARAERRWGRARPLPPTARRVKSETRDRQPATRTILSAQSCAARSAGRIRSWLRLRFRAGFGLALRRRIAQRGVEQHIRFTVSVRDGGGQGYGSHVASQFATQALAQLLDRQVALDFAADGEADRTSLFGANDGNRVGFFGDADAGTMPRAG